MNFTDLNPEDIHRDYMRMQDELEPEEFGREKNRHADHLMWWTTPLRHIEAVLDDKEAA